MLDVSIAPEHIRETTDSIPNGKARSSSSSLIAKARRTTPIIPKIKVIMYILFYVKKFFILYGFDTKVIHEFIRICTIYIRYILCHFFHYTNFKSLGELRGFEPLSLLLRVVHLPINTIALYSFTLRFLPLSSWAWLLIL